MLRISDDDGDDDDDDDDDDDGESEINSDNTIKLGVPMCDNE